MLWHYRKWKLKIALKDHNFLNFAYFLDSLSYTTTVGLYEHALKASKGKKERQGNYFLLSLSILKRGALLFIA